MAKRARRQPFADVVREVASTPSSPEPPTGGITDPSGRYWRLLERDISPSRGLLLASSGASVAWDACGCGGYCGFAWFSEQDVARLVAAGVPTLRNTKRTRGSLSEWLSADGRTLVVAELAVRWGDLVDG